MPALVGLIAVFAGVAVLLIVTGVTSSPDEAGLYRSITFTDSTSADGTYTSAASPYPGWFYAIPLLAALGLLALAAALALRRIATTPSLAGVGLEREDRAWRVASTQVVVNLVSSAVVLQLGGVTLVAGNAIHTAAFPLSVPLATRVAGDALVFIGIAALVASVVWLTLVALRAVGLPHAAMIHATKRGDVREARGR